MKRFLAPLLASAFLIASSHAAMGPALAAEDAAARVLGAKAGPGRAAWISRVLGPAGGTGGSIFALLQPDADGAFAAEGLQLEINANGYGPLRLDGASLRLAPSADGASCVFSIRGSAFGGAAPVEASGTVAWGAGPAGGDGLDVRWSVDAAPVEALRALLPDRVDPSLSGSLRMRGKASGVVGEVTTEDAPATPLRGEVELGSGWTVLGRLAPATLQATFSLDDRMVRIVDGRLGWSGLQLALSGWFDPASLGKFDLVGRFNAVDTAAVARDWNVPAAWVPEAVVTGTVKMAGTPGKGMLRYEATAPRVFVPGLGGVSVEIQSPRMQGSLLALNTDVSIGVDAPTMRIGGVEFPNVPAGLQWWREALSGGTQGSKLWGGEVQVSISYKPAEHPAWVMGGRLSPSSPKDMVANLAPWLDIDLDGNGHATWLIGQTADRTPRFTVHAAVTSGRLGGVELFQRLLDELAAAAPGTDTAAVAALIPAPRRGAGTRLDPVFVEAARTADGFDLGALLLRAGDFRLHADGRVDRSSRLELDGQVVLSEAALAKLREVAPWSGALVSEGDQLVVPVRITGSTKAPIVALAPGYADLVAAARAGRAVEPAKFRYMRHVGERDMGLIPGHPDYIAPGR